MVRETKIVDMGWDADLGFVSFGFAYFFEFR